MDISIFDDEAAREWVVEQISRERLWSGGSRPDAWRAVAGKIGIGAGTVENIERRRLKGLRAWVRDRIQAHKVKWLETEIRKMTHELEIARGRGSRASADEMRAAEAALEAARALLRGDLRG